MNTKQSHIPDWKEKRRYRALELKRADWTHEDIADALGVSIRAVSRWMKAVREEGKAGLEGRPHVGAPPKLSPVDLALCSGLIKTDTSKRVIIDGKEMCYESRETAELYSGIQTRGGQASDRAGIYSV